MTMDSLITLPSGVRAQVSAAVMGEAAEILCELYTDGRRVRRSRRAEDVVGGDRLHYQVKARTYRPNGRKIEIKDDGFDFDRLFVVIFESDRLAVRTAGVIDRSDFQRTTLRRWSDTNDKWEYDLSQRFWSLPGMQIITDELQEYDLLDVYEQVFSELRGVRA